MTVCHDMRNEPHVVGCPRWGTRKTALAFCVLCNGTGSYPDDQTCGQCCGLGEVVYLRYPIRRKDG